MKRAIVFVSLLGLIAWGKFAFANLQVNVNQNPVVIPNVNNYGGYNLPKIAGVQFTQIRSLVVTPQSIGPQSPPGSLNIIGVMNDNLVQAADLPLHDIAICEAKAINPNGRLMRVDLANYHPVNNKDGFEISLYLMIQYEYVSGQPTSALVTNMDGDAGSFLLDVPDANRILLHRRADGVHVPIDPTAITSISGEIQLYERYAAQIATNPPVDYNCAVGLIE